jgi:hypothetical protein
VRLPSSICVLAAGDLLPDVFSGSIEGVAALVDIGQLDRLADADGAAVGLLLAGDHAEQGGLAGAVGADDADDAAGRQAEGHVLEQQAVAVGLATPFGLDDDVPRRGPGGM